MGKCIRCGEKIVLTVHQGGIEKYLSPAMDLIDRYGLDGYYADRLRLVKEEISSLFPSEEVDEEIDDKQVNLTDFMRA
jgi:DNA polymerase II large subunit